MALPEKPQSDDRSVAVVWRFRDQQTLEQELELVFGHPPGRTPWMESALETFAQELRRHPVEWPVAHRAPSEHSFRSFGVEIRYRLIPSDQTVEILSVSSLRPH